MRLPLSSRRQRRRLVLRIRKAVGREQPVLFGLALFIGVLVGYAVIGFRTLIGLCQLAFYGSAAEESFIGVAESLPGWWVLLVATAGGLLVGLFVYLLLPGRRNHGVADIMEACALHGGRMSAKAGVGAAIAAAASIGVGASVGREGPAVHLGASLSAWVAERLRLNRNLSLTLIGCGVAAAVATSFNAPIAGVFFALEVVVGQYALSVFAPIVIASVTATVVTRIHLGNTPAFLLVPDYHIVSFLEVPAFVLLGIVCALIAMVFMYSILFTQDVMARTAIPGWMRPAFGGLAIGVIALVFPQVLGVGYQATDLALREALPLALMLALVAAKILATALALGSGFAGGVFSPAVFIGAMTGGAFGIIAGSVFPEYASTHGAYTILGIAGVPAAVLGAPISTILIVFELTSNYQLTIAVMIVAVVASMLAQHWSFRSFFVWQLARRNITLGQSREEQALTAITVMELMHRDYVTVPLSAKPAQIRALFAGRKSAVACVVDEHCHAVGCLSAGDLLTMGEQSTAAEVVRRETVLLPNYGVEQALKLAGQRDDLIVVNDPAERRIIGMVRYRDLVVAQNQALRGAAEKRGH